MEAAPQTTALRMVGEVALRKPPLPYNWAHRSKSSQVAVEEAAHTQEEEVVGAARSRLAVWKC